MIDAIRNGDGVAARHALKSGCFGVFLLGILFSVLFLISAFIRPIRSTVVLTATTVAATVLGFLVHRGIRRTLYFHPGQLVVATAVFGREWRRTISNAEVRSITGVGEFGAARGGREKYYVVVNLAPFGRYLIDEGLTFEQINREIEALADYLRVRWEWCEELVSRGGD